MITTETPQVTSGSWTGDTKILLADLTTPTIQQLYDELVFNRGRRLPLISAEPATGLAADSNLMQIHLTQFESKLVEVHLSSGEVLRCTDTQMFYVRRDQVVRVPVRLMRESDWMFDSTTQVLSVSYISVPSTPVYDLRVDNTECYYVTSGVLVHDSFGIQL